MAVRTDTLSNVAGTGSPDIVGGELSRCRFNLNGTGTIAARDTYNVSSFVDNGTGDYTVNFAVAFPNADYAAATIGITATNSVVNSLDNSAPPAASSCRVRAQTPGVSYGDSPNVLMIFVGDKP